MIVLCDKCGIHYDDENRWTLCPHGPLWAPLEAYCRWHDLVFCKFCTPPEVIEAHAPRATSRTPIMATTWCGSYVDIRGRFWPWLFGWIRGGWRPSAFRLRREAKQMPSTNS
jgi:hypothetical protein